MTEALKTNGFQKEKVQGFLRSVDKIDAWAASEHGKISKKAQDQINDVRDAGERIGIKKRVLNSVIKRHRLQTKADAVPDEFADSVGAGEGNTELIDQMQAVMLAAGLPLFDGKAEEEKAPKKTATAKAAKKKLPMKGDKKPSLKPEFKDDKTGDKGGTAAAMGKIADAIEKETTH